MNAIALGPLLLSLPRLYALGCALLLLFASRYLLRLPAPRQRRWFYGLLLAWIIGARVIHLLLHIESYTSALLDAVKLWQPGYNTLGGLVAGLIWSAWAFRTRFLQAAIAGGLLAGATLLWWALVAFAPFGGHAGDERLPEITLENLQGDEVNLASLGASGDLIIVNLWATWCPPCRREMPLLQATDARDGVSVVVVNQGESLLPVVRYLDEQSLDFHHALLDPEQRLMARFETPGLPTTLLFDRDGTRRGMHVGELTRAQLERWLAD